MKLSLYENIIVDRDLPEYGLRRGYSVTLVDYVPHPKGGEEGAVLEVFDNLGESISVVTVPVSVINNEIVKTTRATVMIGSIAVDGFMLPDGSYRMSQAQVAEVVGRPPAKASRFLKSKPIKNLLGLMQPSTEPALNQSAMNNYPNPPVT